MMDNFIDARGPLDQRPIYGQYEEIRKKAAEEIAKQQQAELEKLQKAEDKIYESLMASGDAKDMKDLMIALMLIRRAKGALTR